MVARSVSARSDPDPLAALTKAVLSLVKELHRYNDANAPLIVSTMRTAEIYSARYGEEEREKDEMHESLVALEAENRDGRALGRSKRRSS